MALHNISKYSQAEKRISHYFQPHLKLPFDIQVSVSHNKTHQAILPLGPGGMVLRSHYVIIQLHTQRLSEDTKHSL